LALPTRGALLRRVDDPFLARVIQLAGEATQVDVFDGELCVLRPEPTRRIVIARHRPDGERVQLEELGKIMRGAGPISIEVLLVGGPETLRTALKKERPAITAARQYVYHLSDSGSLWSEGEGPSFAGLRAAPPMVDAEVLAAFERQVAAGREHVAAERAEINTFTERLRAARPILTWTLLATVAALFAVEQRYGTTGVTLYHMGALHPPSVRDGEIWRVASCTFLHGGLIHVIMNGFVLYTLGTFLEKIIGAWRFALLYAASAVGGSLVSFLTLKHSFSVGASGALWGCLGAHAVLAFRPAGLLPSAMIPGARSAAMMNLVANVSISFLPHVDWAAHAGGGVVGAALCWLILRRGLPSLEGATGGVAPSDRRPAFVAPAAVAVGGLLVAGLALAIVRGRVWELRQPPVLETRSIAELEADVLVPTLLGARRDRGNEDDRTLRLGRMDDDTMFDPALLRVTRVTTTAPDARRELDAARSGTRAIIQPHDEVLGGHPAMVARFHDPTGTEQDIVYVFTPAAAYLVLVARDPSFPEWADLATSVAASIQPHGS
jgi:membrane associated rhomboid family serine protease